MILYDFEKMTIFANALNDPSMKEVLSYSAEISALLFLIFFAGYLIGQILPVLQWGFDKLLDYLDRKNGKKGDSDD